MMRRLKIRPFRRVHVLLLCLPLLLIVFAAHKPHAKSAAGKNVAAAQSAKHSKSSAKSKAKAAKQTDTATTATKASPPTYAERLGWPAGSRVVIFHVDDVGLSHDSNAGAIEALEKGVASSASVMMPCPWVPDFAHYWKAHPNLDIGLHLTLTSEWKGYRWGPLAGRMSVPDLVDPEGYLWPTVQAVRTHARPAEVECEICAQIAQARAMGLAPTHLDTHMWTLMDRSLFKTYLNVGVAEHIPVLVFNGHQTNVSRVYGHMLNLMHRVAKGAWAAGMPVLDELYSQPLRGPDLAAKKQDLARILHEMKPGVAQFIVHCTLSGEEFNHISRSGPDRLDDLKLMTDPALRDTLRREGIIQTTWRELQQRRSRVK